MTPRCRAGSCPLGRGRKRAVRNRHGRGCRFDHGQPEVFSGRNDARDSGGVRFARRPVIKRRARVVFDSQLNISCFIVTEEFSSKSEGEIDSGGNTCTCDPVSVADDSFGHRFHPKMFQHSEGCPVARGPISGQQTRGSEDERSGTNGRNPAGLFGLELEELQSLRIIEEFERPRTPGNKEDIALRAVSECRRGHYGPTGIGDDRIHAMPREVNLGIRQSGEDLCRPREIQLGDPGEKEDNNSQRTGCHGFRVMRLAH